MGRTGWVKKSGAWARSSEAILCVVAKLKNAVTSARLILIRRTLGIMIIILLPLFKACMWIEG
jgi:hypothetical protein